MPELMVKLIDIDNILKSCRTEKDIMLSKSQRIAANPIIIVAKQKILCGSFVRNLQATRLQNGYLFI